MYNLDNIVRIYFSSVSAQMIIKNKINYKNFSADEFSRLAKAYIQQYSETESQQLYEYIKDGVSEEGHPFAGEAGRCGLNVFAALEELSDQLLTKENNKVCCCYNNLLRFREITGYIEEDLLVCAYLAVRCKRLGEICSRFNWNTTVGHNNVQMRRILERGISENHFHLYGSAPPFHLMWLYFMNHICDLVLAGFAKAVEQKQRVTREHYSIWYSEDSFLRRILKAALIRRHLIKRLFYENSGLKEKKDAVEEFIDTNLEDLLTGENIEIYCKEIQNGIDKFRNCAILKGADATVDYALWVSCHGAGTEEYDKWNIGERWLIYQMLIKEMDVTQRCFSARDFQLFYAYLVIKQSVRGEVIQVNSTVGFENFKIYSNRKNFYPDYQKMIKTAIYGSIENGNIRALEMRITPSENACDNAKKIIEIDRIVTEMNQAMKRCKYSGVDWNHYYVFHFSKQKDEPLGKRGDFSGYRCRHYKKRRQLERQADAIYFLRERYREAASEVLGIDACSQEIGCRPEVFAPVFRFLSEHTVEDIFGVPRVSQLKKTYHVGEDFLDVVDGLRAVDEAIQFLNLQCGDRIGHGTVLGIDAKRWYEFKQNTIVLTKQDYLDNVVWLYHKLVEYKIEGQEILLERLLQDFECYFSEIYLHMETGERNIGYFNIYTYYEAWKLRGDEPELYAGRYYDKSGVYTGKEWLVNRKFPEKFSNREREDIGYLYYLYHYDWDVKNNGAKSVQIYISPVYVDGVVAVQKAMCKEFASRGIGVEANPSSNLTISTMQDYAEHPIVRLYNKDMTWNIEKLQECPQVNISINTDDKGIFHTSLENEYALMACAMEKVKDEKGAPIYDRQMIYHWIDNIREMGNLQSFWERENEVEKMRYEEV